MFSFERLVVYQRSVQFLALAARIISEMPRGSSFLADQLERASLSVPANIAEGTGRPSGNDERRHYGIARGSVMECAVILHACRIHGYADLALVAEGRRLLYEVVSMQTTMSLSPESKFKSKSKSPRRA